MANRHTIILMQSSPNRATRTFMDYDSISQAMDGICGLYERKLKEINPTVQNITYDISDLYNFIDGLTDLSALMFTSFTLIPLGLDQESDVSSPEEAGFALNPCDVTMYENHDEYIVSK